MLDLMLLSPFYSIKKLRHTDDEEEGRGRHPNVINFENLGPLNEAVKDGWKGKRRRGKYLDSISKGREDREIFTLSDLQLDNSMFTY